MIAKQGRRINNNHSFGHFWPNIANQLNVELQVPEKQDSDETYRTIVLCLKCSKKLCCCLVAKVFFKEMPNVMVYLGRFQTAVP